MDDVTTATEAALSAATHLTAMDKGAVEALRVLARKIDAEDTLREAAIEWAEADEKRKPPPIDNVSVPTYLKFCESLGLTPAGRARLELTEEKPGGKLAQLRSVNKSA